MPCLGCTPNCLHIDAKGRTVCCYRCTAATSSRHSTRCCQHPSFLSSYLVAMRCPALTQAVLRPADARAGVREDATVPACACALRCLVLTQRTLLPGWKWIASTGCGT
eukprot:3423268-Rhodomonas_salina.2